MLPPEQYDEIVRLLSSTNLSHRQIAERVGVSRTIVSRIASGRRPRYQPPEDWEEPLGPAVRCPGCGGLVYPPCRLCRIRAMKNPKPDRRQSPRNWLT